MTPENHAQTSGFCQRGDERFKYRPGRGTPSNRLASHRQIRGEGVHHERWLQEVFFLADNL